VCVVGFVTRKVKSFSGSSARASNKMFKGLVLMKSPHLTKRALDAGESPRFSGIFSASAFFSFGRRSAARPSASNAHR